MYPAPVISNQRICVSYHVNRNIVCICSMLHPLESYVGLMQSINERAWAAGCLMVS